MNDKEDEYLHYISRSSTEFYLSGRYKSELYLTPHQLLDSDSDEIDSKRCFEKDHQFSPKLELPPHEIESRIEEFLNDFRQNGMGILAKRNLVLDCSGNKCKVGLKDDGGDDDDYDDSKQPKFSHLVKSRSNKKNLYLSMPNRIMMKMSTHNGKQSNGKSTDNVFKSVDCVNHKDEVLSTNVKRDKQTKDKNSAEEICLDSCNFRVSWVSNESSSTPSGPRRSMTSPSDNNYISSSLASSGASQMEEDRWTFDFPLDNFDYPDHRTTSEESPVGFGDASGLMKSGNASTSASIFRILPRNSSRPSLTFSGLKKACMCLSMLLLLHFRSG